MRHRTLCFGESNTYGYDPRFYLGGRYLKSVRWTGRLEAEGWEVLNADKNGRSIPQLDFEIEAAARSVQKLSESRFSNFFIEKRGSLFAQSIVMSGV